MEVGRGGMELEQEKIGGRGKARNRDGEDREKGEKNTRGV